MNPQAVAQLTERLMTGGAAAITVVEPKDGGQQPLEVMVTTFARDHEGNVLVKEREVDLNKPGERGLKVEFHHSSRLGKSYGAFFSDASSERRLWQVFDREEDAEKFCRIQNGKEGERGRGVSWFSDEWRGESIASTVPVVVR